MLKLLVHYIKVNKKYNAINMYIKTIYNQYHLYINVYKILNYVNGLRLCGKRAAEKLV